VSCTQPVITDDVAFFSSNATNGFILNIPYINIISIEDRKQVKILIKLSNVESGVIKYQRNHEEDNLA
jgi:hypothetical protein